MPAGPIGASLAHHIEQAASAAPMPLRRERIRVRVRGALALVSREQTFRNDEDASIEATITFCVPIQATLHRLSATIGGRTLTATARPRKQAREDYEGAIDQGKTAVLHEELLRGIHMLSVAHIPPGAEVVVTHAWIAALSPRGRNEGFLRIPVSLGDIYGVSPLSDADDIVASGSALSEAELEIDAGASLATVSGVSLANGRATVRLDHPIDIGVSGDLTRAVPGVSADGRSVTVRVSPDGGGDFSIDAALLVDRSGSMAEAASMASDHRSPSETKHAAVVAGLEQASRELGASDRVELWQFDSEAGRVAGPEAKLAHALSRLGEPRGGTEIGAALGAVVASSRAPDIVLITDGLSHALDVHALASAGRRFTVVLVGEDSFEANVGRLAALTGGQILLAAGSSDAGDAVRRAVASLRRPAALLPPLSWPASAISLHAGGALIEASWGTEKPEAAGGEFETAVGAMAAALAIAAPPEDQATKVAAEHGIVCHLTSLILIDEAGDIQEGLPRQRKVPIMEARNVLVAHELRGLRHSMESYADRYAEMMPAPASPADAAPRSLPSLAAVAIRIDWNADPEALRSGNLRGVPRDVANAIRTAAKNPSVAALARPNRDPVVLVIGLIARSAGPSNRAAERIARAILGTIDPRAVAEAMAALGL